MLENTAKVKLRRRPNTVQHSGLPSHRYAVSAGSDASQRHRARLMLDSLAPYQSEEMVRRGSTDQPVVALYGVQQPCQQLEQRMIQVNLAQTCSPNASVRADWTHMINSGRAPPRFPPKPFLPRLPLSRRGGKNLLVHTRCSRGGFSNMARGSFSKWRKTRETDQ
jgi:hypothetical protein